MQVYDTVENKHKNHILDQTIAPAPGISDKISQSAKKIAINIANELDLIGILAIELFELNNGDLIVNEIAPRHITLVIGLWMDVLRINLSKLSGQQ